MKLWLMIAPLVLGLSACGGKQGEVHAAPEHEQADAPCCLDDRWEEPPPRVGQTPPDRPADPDALDEFEPEGSGE